MALARGSGPGGNGPSAAALVGDLGVTTPEQPPAVPPLNAGVPEASPTFPRRTPGPVGGLRRLDERPPRKPSWTWPYGTMSPKATLGADPTTVLDMAGVVLRVRFTSGDHTDVRFEDTEVTQEDQVIEMVISTLAADSGVLRCHHGDRLLVLFGRGVASVELAPRGAVL